MSAPQILISPVILKFYLYRHNYGDRKLLAELKKHFFHDDEGAHYVRADVLARVVRDTFGVDLRSMRNQPKERLSEKATSVFFLDQILSEYLKLKYLHVQVLDDEVYSRRLDDTINFDYRIVYSKMDLSAVVDPAFLHEIKEVFRRIGVYDHTLPCYDRPPYFEMHTGELVRRLEDHRSSHAEGSEEWVLVDSILPFFNNKLNHDDSRLLIVMEN
jgi:hypothetical protein